MKKYIAGLLLVLISVSVIIWVLRHQSPKIQHVLLISIDTCRADHLSCYGYYQETTPAIDSLAKNAVLFENCISPIPLTLPSHASILTGVNPLTHGVHDNVDYRLDNSNLTLAEILGGNGYATAAIVSTYVLNRQFGINQGFDTYNDEFENPMSSFYETERRGDEATRFACDWLESHKEEKSFLFLHYYDPHQSYRPPEPFASRFADNLYAGEIAYVDHCISQVIEKLKDLGIYENTLLIVTGDHGEGRGDHGENQHGYYVYQSCIHVPLIIKSPGKAKNIRIADTVGLIDLVPTICGQLGIVAPETCAGIDLGGYLNKESVLNERYLYSESLLPTRFGCSPLMSVVQKDWKYIQAPRAELYNLAQDPSELNNLIDAEPKRARLYKDNLKLIVQEQVRANNTETLKLDTESRNKLESLGYVAGHSVTEDFEFDESKDDPKDWFFVNQQIMLITGHMKAEQYSEAEKICLEVLNDKPDYILTYYYLAGIQHKLQEYEKAIANAKEFLSRMDEKLQGHSQDTAPVPDQTRYWADAYNILGMCYAETQQYTQALDCYQTALTSATQDLAAQIHYNIGNIHLNQQRFELAINSYQTALELNPNLPELHLNAGIAYFQQNILNTARQHFKMALDLKPGWPLATQNLAAVDRKETLLESLKTFQSSLEKNPNQPDILSQVASIYYMLGDKAAAVRNWKKVISLSPKSDDTLNNLAYLLSEDPKSEWFDASQAVEFAKSACELTEYKNLNYLDTLGRAYAASGNFDRAVEMTLQAITLANAANQSKTAQELQKSIEAYQSQRLP